MSIEAGRTPKVSALSAPSLDARGDSAERRGTRRQWQTIHARLLYLTDAAVVCAVLALAQWVRFAFGDVPEAGIPGSILLGAAVAGAWLVALSIVGTRKPTVIGRGEEEYRLVTRATLQCFGFIAILSFLLESFVIDLDAVRIYLGVALPLGLVGLLLGRRGWRREIGRRRERGEFRTSVLVIGGDQAVEAMVESFTRDADAGYRVVGVCTPGYTGKQIRTLTAGGLDIPVLGGESDVLRAVELTGADTVAVATNAQWGNSDLADLAWDLEPYRVDLVVAPGVTDIASLRLSMYPVGGLPLVHVEEPQYRGSNRMAKTVFDLVSATLALLAFAPVMLTVAALIKIQDRGPVFYRQERVGLNGATFRMWKFRSMVTGADKMIDVMREEAGSDRSVFYKSSSDPRITPVGRFIRRTSIDELPQLFNVLSRDMSLVGPRPLTVGEGLEIPRFVDRRMLVRPGMTGLWQVSGRSNLSEADRVRLDLFYVANWSMVQDLLIVAKTVRAVLASDGAY
ncbi:sugar transferase [Rhodococcus coprophilus]|uniref:sugar transferase n=1 Tax=Rhodococcus coprophilus TaxID=38310 RepID=UPI0009344DDC|nr:sugar transferase [Rhodococcus coprophilus]MBM7459419.1 exopolysaccharide biosynthesis polyprenyl glycosylphosphotransferase [Rhodococcus coprophilus]